MLLYERFRLIKFKFSNIATAYVPIEGAKILKNERE